MTDFPQITLVTGGIASGKSAWAERLVLSSGLSPVYIATAQALDDEMRAKIARHKARRTGQWRLVEAPLDLAPTLARIRPGEIALVDCLTMWLSNHLMAGLDTSALAPPLIEALSAQRAPVVMVTNEVGLGGINPDPLARRFADAQGALNQQIAARADLVVAVMAGLPLALKGQIPSLPPSLAPGGPT